MGFIREFREFAVKGNAFDLAVGVIIGAAFGKIVDSVVKDLIMPVIGIFFNADFTNLYLPLSGDVPRGLGLEEARKLGPVLAWGNFITIVLNFLILAMIVFWIVKAMNKMRKPKVAEAVAPNATEVLLTEIRDTLRQRNP